MSDRIIDFDAARAERKARMGRTILRAFGQDLEIPGTPPAGYLVLVSRLRERGDGYQPGEDEVFDMIRAAIGAEQADVLFRSGLEMEDMEDLLRLVTAAWGERLGEAMALPEGPAGPSVDEAPST